MGGSIYNKIKTDKNIIRAEKNYKIDKQNDYQKILFI